MAGLKPITVGCSLLLPYPLAQNESARVNDGDINHFVGELATSSFGIHRIAGTTRNPKDENAPERWVFIKPAFPQFHSLSR